MQIEVYKLVLEPLYVLLPHTEVVISGLSPRPLFYSLKKIS